MTLTRYEIQIDFDSHIPWFEVVLFQQFGNSDPIAHVPLLTIEENLHCEAAYLSNQVRQEVTHQPPSGTSVQFTHEAVIHETVPHETAWGHPLNNQG